ncbi:diguanylate cyclase domain-containing protein [Pseudomonas sp.]|uniref:diguanylate cyclase domain-containing protein n=1 Tax=Pseudomonas sp. TaxID=306 RepID=UPI003BB5D619
MLPFAGRIERKLFALLAIAYLSLFVVVGAIWGIRADIVDGRNLESLHRALYRLAGTLSLLTDAETGQRGYLLTGNEAYLQPYLNASERLEGQLMRLHNTPALADHKDDLVAIERLAEMKMQVVNEIIDLRRNKGFGAARELMQLNRGKVYMDELRQHITRLETHITQALEQQRADLLLRSRVMLWGGGTIALAMLALLVLLYRDLRGDLRERGELLKRLAFESQHDPLTQLPNRRVFNESLDQALALARRAERKVGLMYLDLDGFKPVNDEYGHAAGDRLLKAIAERWCQEVREGEVLARLGGDEFAVIVEGDAPAIERLAQRLMAALDQPLLGDLPHARVSVSIGMAQYPQHGEDRRWLVAAADAAMYQAKEAGKQRYAWPAGMDVGAPAG